ncbi:MAG: hypothetical protein IKK21_07735 [Clostridia bacterium]|nr:hypothetical protein [Clostridia bacterium]
MRQALAVTAGLLAGLLGTRYAAALRQNAKRLTRWDALLAHLSLLMQEQAYALPEALRQAADGGAEADALLQSIAAQMGADPLCRAQDASLPDWAEAPVLARMLRGISAGSLEARVQSVESARAEIALIAQTASAASGKDAKMWAQLGWLGGACLTVLLV